MSIKRERLLGYRVENADNGVRVFFSGRMTFDDNDCFHQLLGDERLGREGECVVFDFSELEFIDSSGISMLLIASEELSNKNCGIRFDNERAQVSKVFDLTKIRGYIEGLKVNTKGCNA